VASAVTPSVGPERGGTRVTVLGSSFRDAYTLRCRFENASSAVLARYVDENQLECITPVVVNVHPAQYLHRVRIGAWYQSNSSVPLAHDILSNYFGRVWFQLHMTNWGWIPVQNGQPGPDSGRLLIPTCGATPAYAAAWASPVAPAA
jgi:hypothetical protein